jgi:hypothetical protein
VVSSQLERSETDLLILRCVSELLGFWTLEAAGLERGPLSLVGTTEELLEGKVAAPV